MIITGCETLDMFGAAESDAPLDGERLSLYDFEKTLQQDSKAQFGMPGTKPNNVIALPKALKGGVDEAISLVAPWENKFWPQNGGYPNHAMKHLAFTPAQPEKLWSSDIGRGGSDRMPLNSSPIMADNKIFTLNNDSEVRAFDAQTGGEIWESNVIKPGEDDNVLGGGLAFSGGRIFVTNGFNELIALSADSGEMLWRVSTKEPVRAAPSALPNKVFITTMNNRTIAFNAKTGIQLWDHRGLSSNSGVLGGAQPALDRDIVIAAYESGEIYALHIDTGVELWSENLSPLARTAGRTILSDIQALPIIDSNIVYAVSYDNRMSAIDALTGRALWSIPIGAASTPWLSGNRIFVIESQGTILSLDQKLGTVIWQSALPQFEDEKDREGEIIWQGPYLAENRLLAFGSHGIILAINPTNGSIIEQYDFDDDVYLSPLIAKEVLYTLDDNGRVSAWR